MRIFCNLYHFKSKFITFGFSVLIHTQCKESCHCKSLGFYSKTFYPVMYFEINMGPEQTKTPIRSQASTRQAVCLRQGRQLPPVSTGKAWPEEPTPAAWWQQAKKQGEEKNANILELYVFSFKSMQFFPQPMQYIVTWAQSKLLHGIVALVWPSGPPALSS